MTPEQEKELVKLILYNFEESLKNILRKQNSKVLK